MARIKIQKWSEIEMDYLKGMDLEQISGKYGVSINTLKSRIRRGNWKQKKELLKEEVKRGIIEEMIQEGKQPLLVAQEEWRQASLKMYQELIDKVKESNEIEEINTLLIQFMTFCKMNEVVYQPENPEAVYVVR
ncbi:MAG: hypothetical protein JXA07_01950 [Spirochaetes bacterium]|nr:hypothetical protein [Spirochaetota bacterium]